MKRIATVIILFAIIVFFTAPAFAEEGVPGSIDWVNGYIIGYGFGSAKPGINKALARAASVRAAKVDAMRNLLETIKGVNIDSSTLVENFMAKKDVISARVDGVIKGAQMISHKTEWLEGSPLTTVEMRVCISASGEGCSPGKSLVSALDLTKFKDSQQIPKQVYKGETAQPQAVPQKIDYQYDSGKPVTGVIFSLQGYYYKRVVLPVISTKEKNDLKTVYSFRFVEPRIIRTYGIVRFADTLDQAKNIKKIGDNVMVVPVENVTDVNAIIISRANAQKVYETTRHGNDYLKKAKVVISSE